MEHGGFHGYQRLVNSSSGTIKLEINHSLNHHAPTNNTSEQDPNAREQDRYMPIANVIKIMPKVLPTHAKIYDDAKEMIQECVSEYVSFITGEANEQCQREQRKTITANDVLYAMRKLGFDDYVKPLSLYIQRYRELDSERGSTRSERVMKRSAEMSSMGVVAFEPDFHISPHQGLFGAPMRGYLRDGSGASSSQAGLPGFNPYVSYK